MSMQMVVKTEGAVLKIEGDITVDEHIELGYILAAEIQRTHWRIGDWYHATPKMQGSNGSAMDSRYLDVYAAMGVKPRTVEDYGYVSKAFPLEKDRAYKIPYGHFAALARSGLNGEQRRQLLERAVTGEWNRLTLKKEIANVKGLPPPESKVGRPKGDETTANIVDDIVASEVERIAGKKLPKSVAKEAISVAKKAVKAQQKEFNSAVERAATERVKEEREKLDEWRQRLWDKSKKVDKQIESAAKLRSGIKAFIEYEEYRFMLSACHPDKVASWDADKANRITEILVKIGEEAGWKKK